MDERVPTPFSLALAFLRGARGWSQAQLAAASGTHKQTISDCESGRRRLPSETFDGLVAAMGYTQAEVQLTLVYISALRAASGTERLTPIDPSPEEDRQIRRTAAYATIVRAGVWRERMRQASRNRRTAEARAAAGDLWQEVQTSGAARLRRQIETRGDLQTWAFAERLCDESERAAPRSAERAMALAQLALQVADLAPVTPAFRSCLSAYAHAFLGNAARVAEDLVAADTAFATAWHLWRAGTPSSGYGPLGEWRLLDLEASLRRDQRRFETALSLLRRALVTAPAAARGRILLNLAHTLEQAGQVEAALAALDEAAPLVDAAAEPRERMGVRFNRLVNLYHLGRFREAAAGLPELRALIAPAHDADNLRFRWLSGRIAAGLGDRDAAFRTLEGVRHEFAARRAAYDSSLVSLDLAILHLEQGDAASVASLAEEMIWVFTSRRIHREALAALRLFVQAAQSGNATLEKTRQVLAALERMAQAPGPRAGRTA